MFFDLLKISVFEEVYYQVVTILFTANLQFEYSQSSYVYFNEFTAWRACGLGCAVISTL